jgi:hypothetical protein
MTDVQKKAKPEARMSETERFGHWCFELVWSLMLGAWSFHKLRIVLQFVDAIDLA